MRPHGRRASVSPGNPVAFGQCDRCGCWVNRTELQWQYQWSGTHIYSLGILVCNHCYDTPFEQLRTIILPPDPPPVINARPPNFVFEEAGPIQGILAATSLAGSNMLQLQPANGLAVQGAGSFNIGDFIWVQLVTGNFAEMQINAIAGNVLSLVDPLPATAPINGSVTFISSGVVAPQLDTLEAFGSLLVDSSLTKVAFGELAASGSLETEVNLGLTGASIFGGAGALVGLATQNFPWLPLLGTISPTTFADFTTEGTSNHYWYNGLPYYSGFASWLSVLSGSFSRASSGYYTNSSGLLASAATNVIRFDNDSGGNPIGLLLEGASTNLVEFSGALSNSYWTGGGGSFGTTTVVSSSITDPTGGTAGVQFTFTNTGNGSDIGVQFIASISGTFTFSIWLYGTLGQTMHIEIDDGVTFAQNHITLTASWVRYTITYTSNSNRNAFARFGTRNLWGSLGTASTVYVWGAQVEALPFASSYVPTTNSTASRAADSLTYPTTTPTQTTLFAKVIIPPAFNSAADQYAFSLGDGTTGNQINLDYETNGTWEVLVWSGGSATLIVTDFSVVGGGSLQKAAFALQTNSLRASFNSGSIVSASSGAIPVTISEVALGRWSAGGSAEFNGHIQQFGQWLGTFATDAQLQTLTS